MRISDWSSDVCSSDLAVDRRDRAGAAAALSFRSRLRALGRCPPILSRPQDRGRRRKRGSGRGRRGAGAAGRSEEHTSELQSLMRISYAVFCLKKNTKCLTCIHKSTTEITQTKYVEA